MVDANTQRASPRRQPIPTNEERAARNLEAERRASRDRLWALLRTAGLCVFWCCTGLLGIALGFHSDDRITGNVYFYGGIAIGNAGMLATLHMAYVRARERGDME